MHSETVVSGTTPPGCGRCKQQTYKQTHTRAHLLKSGPPRSKLLVSLSSLGHSSQWSAESANQQRRLSWWSCTTSSQRSRNHSRETRTQLIRNGESVDVVSWNVDHTCGSVRTWGASPLSATAHYMCVFCALFVQRMADMTSATRLATSEQWRSLLDSVDTVLFDCDGVFRISRGREGVRCYTNPPICVSHCVQGCFG